MKPLAGCRVLDLGIITAGAATSAVLADLGAEVIKVESPSYRDPFRRWHVARPEAAAPDRPPYFVTTNRGKRGLSLDLKRPEGRAVFLELVARSDVIVENFRRGVMAKLGLDFAALAAVNPRILLASVSSQGESGPDAASVSYGSTLEAVSGLAWTTGYQDGPPTVSGVDLNYPDQVVALFAAGMIVSAWQAEPRIATHLDLSQRELTSFLLGDAIVAAGAGLDTSRQGNAQSPYWLQECFRCADGRWIALSVAPAQRAALATLVDGLRAGDDVLRAREAVQAWCARLESGSVETSLQSVRIAAARVARGAEVLAAAGQLWRHAVQRTPSGVPVKGFALQFDDQPMRIECDAPGVGEHSIAVLRELGLEPARIDALRASGVVEQGPSGESGEATHVH